MLKISTSICQILLILVLSIVCSSRAAAKTSISGEIKNLPKGKLQLILEEDINRKRSKVVAEIPFDKNGRFRFERDLPPHIYSLKIDEDRSIMLAVGKGQKIFVTGDAAGSNQFDVTGSEDTTKLKAYEIFRKESLTRLVISIRNQIKELKGQDTPENDPRLLDLARLEVQNYAEHKDELIDFIRKKMGISLAIYPTSIRWDGEKNIPFLRQLSKEFQNAHPGTAIAARLNEKVEAIAANSVGGKAAAIKMPDKTGKLISLSSIKARYILIDFWGSWCAPCRGESRLLSELYGQFKPMGFEIYGVGLESSRAQWLKAIAQDKRVWTNVSTFQEFATPVTFDYAVTSLPVNVLIDGAGRVVARNVHGQDLRRTLQTLFTKTKPPVSTGSKPTTAS